jgi:hypothetical protein
LQRFWLEGFTPFGPFSFLFPRLSFRGLYNESVKFPKEKSRYLADASFAAIFLIVAYLLFVSIVLIKGLLYKTFAARDGAFIAVGMVIFGGVMCGLFYAVTGSMARVSVYSLAVSFSLYEAVTSFDHLYLLGSDPLLNTAHIVQVAVGVFLLFAFLLGALSFILDQKRLILLKASRIFFDGASILFALASVLNFVDGEWLEGLMILCLAFVAGAIPFALKALDLLPEALEKGL